MTQQPNTTSIHRMYVGYKSPERIFRVTARVREEKVKKRQFLK